MSLKKLHRPLVLCLMMAGLSGSAFAVDGTILIDQNRALAGNVTPGDAPGFPVTISQPGSYKLSGNLNLSTTDTGNYLGQDVAIVITGSGVVLDLNGFSIIVNNTIPTLNHGAFAVWGPGAVSQVSIKNGVVTVNSVPFTQATAQNTPVGILLLSCVNCSAEDLSVTVVPSLSSGFAVGLSSESLIRHNRLKAPQPSGFACPSVIVENTGISLASQAGLNAGGCVALNNVP